MKSSDVTPLIYRRAISVESSRGRVDCEIEDDFHHFRVGFDHDGAKILKIDARSIRFPWTACGRPSAEHFAGLSGMPLRPLRELLSRKEYFDYCTHMSDILDLGINLQVRGGSLRLYEIEVQVGPGGPATGAIIWRDGVVELQAGLSRGTFTAPAELAGVTVDDLYGWAQKRYDGEDRGGEHVEMLGVLQRAIYVSFGKGYDWHDRETAAEMGMPPVCFTMAPQRVTQARQMQNTERDFSANRDRLLDGRVAALRQNASKNNA